MKTCNIYLQSLLAIKKLKQKKTSFFCFSILRLFLVSRKLLSSQSSFKSIRLRTYKLRYIHSLVLRTKAIQFTHLRQQRYFDWKICSCGFSFHYISQCICCLANRKLKKKKTDRHIFCLYIRAYGILSSIGRTVLFLFFCNASVIWISICIDQMPVCINDTADL